MDADKFAFDLSEVDQLAADFLKYGKSGTRWEYFKHRNLRLPEWFDISFQSDSAEYCDQQNKLWQVITGITELYDPALHELANDPILDRILFPGWYSARGPGVIQVIGDHFIALGQLLKRSRLNAGGWVLEYGAGYGQIAVTLGRLGMNVDTVDLNPGYCESINGQADLLKINIRAHQGKFGFSPKDQNFYDAIIFYESFHHCVDFFDVVHLLRKNLKSDGQVLLAGEPIVISPVPALPYDWGVRLDAETVAVMRIRGWFELGFQEDFLVKLFVGAGFVWQKHPCGISIYGIVHDFRPRPNIIDLSSYQLPQREGETWHLSEPHGRWTKEKSVLSLDQTESFRSISVVAANSHPQAMTVRMLFGTHVIIETFAPGEEKTVTIDASVKAPSLEFLCDAISPTAFGSNDNRVLGIFVRTITYNAE